MALPSRRKFVILGFISIGSLNAQEVFTNPVGFVRLGNTTAGEPAVQADTDVYLTIPLERKLEAAGTVGSVTADSITLENSPSWANDQWLAPSDGGAPYFVTVSSGTENGLRALITGNDSDTLTVEPLTPGDLSNVSVGDALEVRKFWTLGSFFASSNLPNGTEVFLYDETEVGVNQSPEVIYIFGNGNWFVNGGEFEPSNDVLLHSGETFVLRSSSSEIQSLVTFGDVATSNLRVTIQKDAPTEDEDLFVASMSPVPVLVSDSGLPVQNGDELFQYVSSSTSGTNPSPSIIYIFGNGQWFINGGLDTAQENLFTNVTSTLTFDPGAGYILRRSASSPTFAEWTQLAPY